MRKLETILYLSGPKIFFRYMIPVPITLWILSVNHVPVTCFNNCKTLVLVPLPHVKILLSAIREKRHLPALDLIAFLESFKRFDKSEKAEKINGPIFHRAALSSSSMKAVYLRYIRTGNNTAVVTNTASNTRFSVNV
jgi:hypothetical protein